jgi:hypothetical protein
VKNDGQPMTRAQIMELCASLEFNANMVSQIIVYSDHVEVTVWVPIVEDT